MQSLLESFRTDSRHRPVTNCPAERLDSAYDEHPRDNAQERNPRGDGEGPEEIASVVEDEAGEGWTDNAGEIGKAVLWTVPSAYCFSAGDSLAECVNAGRA